MKVSRRTLLSLIGASPAALAGSAALASPRSAKAPVVKTEPGKIEALNPRGNPPPIQLVPMAPRLQSLDGKTIYLVSDGFPGADVFLNQVSVWFSKNMPGVTTVYRQKRGAFADDDPQLFAEMKEKANGVIMAIGHCSTCTPATVGHCITFEKMGLPSAPMVTIAFKDLAKTNAAKRGMPDERICFTPHPVWGKSPEEMYAYLQGNDPVTGKPLMKEVIGALTSPLTADEQKTGTVVPSIGAPTFVDNVENLQKFYMNNGMTDFMPIIIPTQEKVEAMLKGTSHDPEEVIGELTPARGSFPAWKFTVRHVAINAVMAGAEPEYLPIILAISASGLPSLSSSTNSFATAAVINGPIRDKLNMNYGIGAMGPFSQPNATIGRAWTLLSKNLGNCGLPGETYMGTQGNVVNFNNLIIVENEKDSPYTPFHVQKGYKPEENVVSVFFGYGISQGQGGKGSAVKPVPQFDQGLLYNFTPLTSIFGALAVLDPLVAKDLVELGYDSKDKLCDWLQKNATLTVGDAKTMLFTGGGGRRGPGAAALKDDDLIPRWGNKSLINVVVVGGQTNPYYQVANLSYSRSVSIDKWA
ncbi:MAG TPA: UGSC family (seleno)protein [Candidatus Aquilonibacter sp.]|nr:UGSC family (seleno)protein [Candidatus Aquilonibacter sp.]